MTSTKSELDVSIKVFSKVARSLGLEELLGKKETYLILIRVPMGPVNLSTITTLIKHLKTGK